MRSKVSELRGNDILYVRKDRLFVKKDSGQLFQYVIPVLKLIPPAPALISLLGLFRKKLVESFKNGIEVGRKQAQRKKQEQPEE